MNYESYAISRLRDYPAKVVSLQNLRDEIEELEARQLSCKASRFDKEIVQGTSTTRAQDTVLNLIALIDEKKSLFQNNRKEIIRTRRAISVLGNDERKVLDAFFLEPVGNPLQYLMESMGYERTWVYERRREGIRRFARAFYGAVDA